MKVREAMTGRVIWVSPEESVEVAARTLALHNIGALPVCVGGKLCGMVTDRDLVTRCVAANRSAGTTKVRDVMTRQVISVRPDMELDEAAGLMGRQQVRRLPVTENGDICGMISLADLASCGSHGAAALRSISDNICGGKAW